MSQRVKIVECPRDAMQGIDHFIPSDTKVQYMNALLEANFDVLDFGSFVSPKAIPQMSDTAEVLSKLDLSNSKTKLLAIVANERGALEAIKYPEIKYLGFPLSISETFQMRNTGKSVSEGIELVRRLQELVHENNKELVIYISMAFGNPYQEDYSVQKVIDMTGTLQDFGVSIVSISDTIGSASPHDIKHVLAEVLRTYPDVEIGAHLHANPMNAKAKIQAVFNANCFRIDGALKGYGGCPMAKDELTGNIPTELIMECIAGNELLHDVDVDKFLHAISLTDEVMKGT